MAKLRAMPLARLDLNLLVALDALLAERSVTRAARRLGVTQPAASNALARLRAALGDPLLVRTRGGLVPTPLAVELGAAAASALREVERALSAHRPFDPETAERTFTICASDYVALVLLAPLARELPAIAPRVKLRVVPVAADLSLAQLEAGQIDLTVGIFPQPPTSLQRLPLFDDRWVLVSRPDHPVLARKRLDARGLASLHYVQVAPQGAIHGALDIELGKRGLARKVVMSVPQFLATLVVATSDLVAVIPEQLALALSAHAPLARTALPISLGTPRVAAYWHERMRSDSAHAWLGARLADQARRVTG